MPTDECHTIGNENKRPYFCVCLNVDILTNIYMITNPN